MMRRVFILIFIFSFIFGLTATIYISSTYGTELLPPLDVNLTIVEPSPSLGDTITVVLDFVIVLDYRFVIKDNITGKPNVSKAVVTFQARNLEIRGEKSYVVNDVPIGVNQRFKVPVKISGKGKAQFIAAVNFLDAKDNFLFGDSASLYFLTFADEVFLGKGSFIALEIEKIEKDYQRGLISKEEFKKRMEDVCVSKVTE